MSERAAVASILVVAFASRALLAQSAPDPTTELPYIHGRVTDESGEKPVVGALVDAFPAFRVHGEIRTDERGEFTRVGTPKWLHIETDKGLYDFVEFMTITAPGFARTLVDPCADAPWAQPIRMRRSANLSGRFDRTLSEPECQVVVSAPWRDLCWPPRTGFTSSDEQWTVGVDEQGRFEIRDVPSQVPITIRLERARTSHSVELVRDLVLAPGEIRELSFVAPAVALPLHRAPARESSMTWAPVDVRLTTNSPREVNLPAFEIVDGGRFRPHRVGGGHWHVHGWRACDHVEAQPGLRTLIALDARGQIGLARLEVDAAEKSALVQTDIEPGSLLRIAFDGPEERARIALSSQGIEFRARDLPRGAVWYELAPAGEVSIRITSTMADPRSIEVDARAGRIERVEL